MTNEVYQSDLEYIEDELKWIELRSKRIIVKRVISDMSGDDENMFYNASYYHQDETLEALVAKRNLLEKEERKKRFSIDGRIAQTVASGRKIALNTLCELYGLDQIDRWVVLLAASVTFSRRFCQLYGRIWDGYDALVVESVFAFCELPFADRIENFKRFSPTAPLLQHQLVTVNLGGRIYAPQDLLDAQLRMSNRTFDFIVGDDHFMDEFMEFSSVEEPRARLDQVVLAARDKERIRSVVERHDHYLECRAAWGFDDIISYGKGALMLFYGAPGTGKTMMAHAVANEMGMRILNVDIPTFVNHFDAQRFLPSLFREAKLQNAVLFFDECEALFATREMGNPLMTMLLTEIERFEGVAILATNLPQDLDDALERRILVRVEFPKPDSTARRAIWEKHLPAAAPVADDVDLDLLAEQFEMTGGYIKNAVLMAVADAVHRSEAPQITMASLERAAREQSAPPRIGNRSIAQLSTTIASVVAPPETTALLHEIVRAARGRQSALERANSPSMLCGLTVLITGPEGSGKTLCTRAIASALNRSVVEQPIIGLTDVDRFRLDVEASLAEARHDNAVLVLDHVDGLFAADNIAIARWLSATLQTHHGVVILTTTSYGDTTTVRDVDYVVTLNALDEAQRTELWRRHLPNHDVAHLATEPLSGKEIDRRAARILLNQE